VLASTVETAVNALWDAAPLIGDRVAVVGAGMVGCCVPRLQAEVPGVQVTLIDVDAGRAEVAAPLGTEFATLGEVTVVELSWYGDTVVSVDFGGVFDSHRQAIRASQVGAGSATRRLALVLELLHDAVVDVPLRDLLGEFDCRNLDEQADLAYVNTTTEALAKVIADRIADHIHAGALGDSARGIDTLAVMLRESPVGSAGYERPM
jgi:hypothetical protein